MTYSNITEGVFISRPNRFIAICMINGKEEVCHVKNTGRCKELLISGVRVILTKLDNLSRKTQYDLIGVYKNDCLINIDSQAPNKVALEYLRDIFKDAVIKPEYKIGNSRLDFHIDDGATDIFVEVKGCTLEKDGIAMFPDAPTERGIKHINELIACAKNGHRAIILFIVQLKPVLYFTPNYETHKEFGEALKTARQSGVEILAVDCIVKPNELCYADNVTVYLKWIKGKC